VNCCCRHCPPVLWLASLCSQPSTDLSAESVAYAWSANAVSCRVGKLFQQGAHFVQTFLKSHHVCIEVMYIYTGDNFGWLRQVGKSALTLLIERQKKPAAVVLNVLFRSKCGMEVVMEEEADRYVNIILTLSVLSTPVTSHEPLALWIVCMLEYLCVKFSRSAYKKPSSTELFIGYVVMEKCFIILLLLYCLVYYMETVQVTPLRRTLASSP